MDRLINELNKWDTTALEVAATIANLLRSPNYRNDLNGAIDHVKFLKPWVADNDIERSLRLLKSLGILKVYVLQVEETGQSHIDSRVRQAIEWLHSVGVSVIKVGYPKYIVQENGNFGNVHVWTYGYLLRRIYEVAEEYGITVVYTDETYTSSKCPIHGEGCGERIKRGLFKCTKLDKVFNADLVEAFNILITPSPTWDRGNGLEAQPGIEPSGRGDVVPNLPVLAGTLTL
jgi:hypothetical protein